MKRLLLNGSPRGAQSNSRLILSWLLEGMETADAAIKTDSYDLAKPSAREAGFGAFLDADEVVIALPLYTDSVPGIVKDFIDRLASADSAKLKGKRLAFIIQSGFPESIHSETAAAYLERLCARIGAIHCGTIIKGGVEGIRIRPEASYAGFKQNIISAGKALALEGQFPQDIVKALARPRTLNAPTRFLFSLLKPTGMLNFYWNMMLKRNNAYKRRFDAPYGEAY